MRYIRSEFYGRKILINRIKTVKSANTNTGALYEHYAIHVIRMDDKRTENGRYVNSWIKITDNMTLYDKYGTMRGWDTIKDGELYEIEFTLEPRKSVKEIPKISANII